jgi:tRNA1(Val) A37 N6-methylase TrmN6
VPVVATRLEALGVAFVEPRRGYRFGPESPALTEFCVPGRRVLDLGAGCGVIGLSLAVAHRARVDTVTLVERDPTLAACATANAATVAGATVLQADLRGFDGALAFDTVVANPPFFDPGAGNESSSESTRGATHRHAGGPVEFASTAARALAPAGNLWMLHPADRTHELLVAAQVAGLNVVRVVMLDARHTGRPYRAWVEMQRTPAPLVVVGACVATER